MNRKPNKDQTAILELLYRFRFGTSTLFNQYLKPNNRQSLNSRLDILAKQEYIGKNYDKSYKLLGKPASYYLLPKAFAVLRKQEGISNAVLKNMYKDKDASEKFVDRCLTIFAIGNQLEAAYGDLVEFFTKTELTDYGNFPQPLPDAFISLKTSAQPRARTKHYFLELFEDSTPFFVIARRIRQYADYVDSGDWELTKKKLPALLAVCESTTLQKRLLKRFRGLDDFRLCLTTTGRFFASTDEDDAIWQNVAEPDAILKLNSI